MPGPADELRAPRESRLCHPASRAAAPAPRTDDTHGPRTQVEAIRAALEGQYAARQAQHEQKLAALEAAMGK